MKEYNDTEIIYCLRNRESHVVRYLFDRYLPMIRLMVTQFGGTNEDAKDIFQDGLLIMIKRIDQNELILTCKFKTFFYSVCENLFRNVLMKRKAAMNYLTSSHGASMDEDSSENYDNKLYENMFYDMFDTMEPSCKTILKLYWQDFSPKEIAKKLGFTYGYVRKKKCECQGELISKVKNHPEYKEILRTNEGIRTIVNG